MFINPEISRQLAAEHRRDLLADAQEHNFARQFRTVPGIAMHRQPLISRLWRRLRPVTLPRLEPQV